MDIDDIMASVIMETKTAPKMPVIFESGTDPVATHLVVVVVVAAAAAAAGATLFKKPKALRRFRSDRDTIIVLPVNAHRLLESDF